MKRQMIITHKIMNVLNNNLPITIINNQNNKAIISLILNVTIKYFHKYLHVLHK